jgi:subtilisin-like proprotein convertase family protein
MRTHWLLTIGVLIGGVTGVAVVAGASAKVSADVRIIHQSTSIISTADGDLFAEPGEEVSVAVAIRNVGTATATGISATLPPTTVQYPDLAPGAAATNAAPFVITMFSSNNSPCGDGNRRTMTVSTGQGNFAIGNVTPVSAVTRSESWTTTTPVDIPDLSTVESPLTLGAGPMSTILDLNVRINDLSHTWDQDLDITLMDPQNLVVRLASNRGFGANFTNTVFDDEANTPLADGSPPFTGTFRTDFTSVYTATLSQYDGYDATGTWKLRVRDGVATDTGRLNSWSIDAVTARCNEAPTASFTWSPRPAIVGKPVTFTANAADRDGQIASHAWDLDDDGEFDDGAGATARRTFSKPGPAVVRLRVLDDLGNAQIVTSRGLRAVRVCQVPRVVGRSLARARRAIIRAGCRVGRVRRARSRRVGRVISQRPRGRVQRPLGTKVNLVVGSR